MRTPGIRSNLANRHDISDREHNLISAVQKIVFTVLLIPVVTAVVSGVLFWGVVLSGIAIDGNSPKFMSTLINSVHQISFPILVVSSSLLVHSLLGMVILSIVSSIYNRFR